MTQDLASQPMVQVPPCYMHIKSNECIEYSYIGHDDSFVFQEKVKFCSGSNLLFRGLIFDFFLGSVHFPW